MLKKGFVFRNTKSFKNPESIKYLYITLIKFILMQASKIWRPIGNMDRLERIQHKAIRHLAFLSGNPLSRFDHDYASTSTAKTFCLPSVSSSMIASDLLFLEYIGEMFRTSNSNSYTQLKL